ncbi:MAG: hypothetical protein HRT47_06200 [Candidatus Caenarcaniphilales bacterium]|nr:hypothetical protein [Candidatus Caenarcaniphilales bacterium]
MTVQSFNPNIKLLSSKIEPEEPGKFSGFLLNNKFEGLALNKKQLHMYADGSKNSKASNTERVDFSEISIPTKELIDQTHEYLISDKNLLEKYKALLVHVDKIQKSKNASSPMILIGDLAPSQGRIQTCFKDSTHQVILDKQLLMSDSYENTFGSLNHELTHFNSRIYFDTSYITSSNFICKRKDYRSGIFEKTQYELKFSAERKEKFSKELELMVSLLEDNSFPKAKRLIHDQCPIVGSFIIENVSPKKICNTLNLLLIELKMSNSSNGLISLKFLKDTNEESKTKRINNEIYTELSNLCDLYKIFNEKALGTYQRGYERQVKPIEEKILKPLFTNSKTAFNAFDTILKKALKSGDFTNMQKFFQVLDPKFAKKPEDLKKLCECTGFDKQGKPIYVATKTLKELVKIVTNYKPIYAN